MGLTFAQKILAKKAGKATVSPGEIVVVEPDYTMSHDNTSAIAGTFKKMGGKKVWNPDKMFVILDHCIPAADQKYASNHQITREFVKNQAIPNFFDINYGVCHQVLPEQGFALPGKLIVGSDSHTTTYGAFGALAAGIGRSEMAAIWATGEIWLMVPESMKVNVNGKFPKYVTAKDLIVYIIGKIGADGGLYRSMEFYGETIREMTMEGRMTLCNMTAEAGAKNGFVPVDDTTLAWLHGKARDVYEVVHSDPDCEYAATMDIDVSTLEPQICLPHAVDNVKPVRELKGTKVNQVLLGTCTNGRYEDLEAAAEVIKGKKVHPSVRMLVFPASTTALRQAMKSGAIDTLLDAGAVLMNPGCGPCLGAHEGILAPGEVCLSTANRNFKGRMGCNEAFVYLSNPAVVAATAVAGEIVHPDDIR